MLHSSWRLTATAGAPYLADGVVACGVVPGVVLFSCQSSSLDLIHTLLKHQQQVHNVIVWIDEGANALWCTRHVRWWKQNQTKIANFSPQDTVPLFRFHSIRWHSISIVSLSALMYIFGRRTPVFWWKNSWAHGLILILREFLNRSARRPDLMLIYPIKDQELKFSFSFHRVDSMCKHRTNYHCATMYN